MSRKITLAKDGLKQQSCDVKSSCNKPVIMTFVGNYLPGFKAGGILRITVNTVDHLCNEFEFKIVTRDRDLGDDKPYPGVKVSQWQQVGNAAVYYLSPQSATLKNVLKLISDTKHDVLYLNSFFDPLTIKVLLNRRLGRARFKPVIVAPWGEFGWASLKQKYLKKIVFIQLARFMGLYNDVIWRASSEFEKIDIIKFMKIKSAAIRITEDLPVKKVPDFATNLAVMPRTNHEDLRIVFLSRISREKNLDYALMVLRKVNIPVVFDIYGPAENEIYWKECQVLIAQLPDSVKINYLGCVKADQVIDVFSRYDLFLFPTGGEAYGHVIAECLIAGTPVLLSKETPWRDLQADGLGWDIDLEQMDSFVEIIKTLSSLSNAERLKMRAIVKTKMMERLLNPSALEENRRLFSLI